MNNRVLVNVSKIPHYGRHVSSTVRVEIFAEDPLEEIKDWVKTVAGEDPFVINAHGGCVIYTTDDIAALLILRWCDDSN